MVTRLSRQDKHAIASAIQEAEARSSCEMVLTVAPACDAYYSFAIVYGLLLGSLIDLVLWAGGWANLSVPLSLLIQLVPLVLFTEIPQLRHAFTPFVPARIKHVRASQRAAVEYLTVSRTLPVELPHLVIFIAQAERYVHVFGNHNALPDAELEAIAKKLTSAIKAQSLAVACVETIKALSNQLAASHPLQNIASRSGNEVVELT